MGRKAPQPFKDIDIEEIKRANARTKKPKGTIVKPPPPPPPPPPKKA